jgi:hypothetical protein
MRNLLTLQAEELQEAPEEAEDISRPAAAVLRAVFILKDRGTAAQIKNHLICTISK